MRIGAETQVPVNGALSYECINGTVLSSNPYVDPVLEAKCREGGEFQLPFGRNEEWPRCINRRSRDAIALFWVVILCYGSC